MKNKFQLIIPRLLVVTAIAGIATLLIGTIFKVLLVTTILFSIGTLVYSKISRRRKHADYPAYRAAFEGTINGPYLTANPQAIVPVQYVNRASKPSIVPIY
ncbi:MULTISPECIES: hypothetical protein [Sphingobacterium]|uniref:hypothetical protein n=1 Tax=Sphingobacterium TaxID=28453 RepID=UPI0016259F8D|nr:MULTISPECIES: hypothetical protein [Sphingobacterium]MBV2225609.1 hypothetical protein [Sphingobacterium mizutaii]